MERETLKSRLGFILLSAGCAIGIGNVWKFPYIAGQGGGGAFVLFYLIFLVILGLPIMTMEFAVGRASRKSPVRAYQALEKPGQKWHIHGYFTLIGCYLLMMFYTTVAGWMLHYFYMTAAGKLAGLNAEQVAGKFTEMLASPATMTFWMVFVVVVSILVCAKGLQSGLERVTKGMMIALLLIMVVLAVNSLFMPGAKEGLSFFLVPDFAGEFCRRLHQFMQFCQHRGAVVFVQQRCRILFERRVEGFCVRGFEKDQIPGRHLRAVLADGVVDAVLFGVAFQPTDAGLADLHAGHAPVLPQKGADTLLTLGCLGLVQPKCCFYRPQDSPGRQLGGRDHNVE